MRIVLQCGTSGDVFADGEYFFVVLDGLRVVAHDDVAVAQSGQYLRGIDEGKEI